MRELHEQGRTYVEIIKLFAERGVRMCYPTVKAICSFRRRTSIPMWRRVR